MDPYVSKRADDLINQASPQGQEVRENSQSVSRRLYRPCEVWVMLNMSRDTLFGLLRKRELRSMKVGRLRLIPAEAIDEYVARKMAEEDAGY